MQTRSRNVQTPCRNMLTGRADGKHGRHNDGRKNTAEKKMCRKKKNTDGRLMLSI